MSIDFVNGVLREHSSGCMLAVRAQPGAKRTAIAGFYGEDKQAQLKIAIQVLPIEGRANEALIGFLAAIFGMPKSRVQLVSGQSSRSKLFLLRDLALGEARATLQKAILPTDHFAGTA